MSPPRMKRPPGTGTLETLADGRVRVRFRTGESHGRGKGRALKQAGVFATAKEAEKVAGVMAAELTSATAARDVTVADLGDKELLRREVKGIVADPGSERSLFNNHIRPHKIGKMPVRSLTTPIVKRWVEGLPGAPQTKRNARCVLSVICARAMADGLLRFNPCLGVKVAGKGATEDEWHYLELDGQAALIAAAGAFQAERLIDDEPIVELLEWAIGTGAREGEQCFQRLEDLHLAAVPPGVAPEVAERLGALSPTPHVWIRYGGPNNRKYPASEYPKGAPPKWGRIRRVELFGLALEAVERWLAKLGTLCPGNPHGLLFPLRCGEHRDPNHIIRWEWWKGDPRKKRVDGRTGRPIARRPGIIEIAGIRPDFRWHDLRHTCGSSLVSGWWGRSWSLEEVRDFLGHKDIKTTQRYAKLGPTAMKRAAAEASAAWRGGPRLFPGVPSGRSLSSGKASNIKEPPAGIEPAASGLGNRRAPESLPALTAGKEQAGNTARAVLVAASEGDDDATRAAALALAAAVLSSRAVVLAREVAEGGPHATTAALELAALVASSTAPAKRARAAGQP